MPQRELGGPQESWDGLAIERGSESYRQRGFSRFLGNDLWPHHIPETRCSFFLFPPSPSPLASQLALPAGSRALLAGSRALPAGSRALLAFLETLQAGFRALPPSKKESKKK